MELSEIAEKIDIVDYVGQYVDLEYRNGDYFGLCPFHEENTASFSIMPATQKFYCFGCGAHGDVIDFAKMYHHWSTARAVHELKIAAGVDENTPSTIRLSATKEAKKFIARENHRKPQPHTILPDDVMEQYEWRDDKLQTWADEGIPLDEMKRF